MSRRFTCVLLAGLGLASAGGLFGSYAAAQPPPAGGERPPAPRDQPPRPAPDQEAAGILQHAYDNLALVRVWTSSGRAKLPQDDARLADQAEDFYRTAHKAYKDRDFNRAALMGLAAATASQGLISVLHAYTPPPSGLPAPPEPPAAPAAPAGREDFPPPPRTGANRQGEPPAPGDRGGERAPAASEAGNPAPPRTPKDMARDLLRAAYRSLGDAEKADTGNGPSRAFLDASRAAYQEGRKDYDAGNYRRALDLAAAAEAWSHIGEYLKRAESPNRPGAGRREPPPPEEPQESR